MLLKNFVKISVVHWKRNKMAFVNVTKMQLLVIIIIVNAKMNIMSLITNVYLIAKKDFILIFKRKSVYQIALVVI